MSIKHLFYHKLSVGNSLSGPEAQEQEKHRPGHPRQLREGPRLGAGGAHHGSRGTREANRKREKMWIELEAGS